ncbi:MAG TPA: hypothetical protein VNY05_03560 [Candidatus Acidoferrales bacterium]|jgi:hypothetical protein|nr:hypothetical protein [Candidatus Acidoferrales bacterium]
MAHTPQPVCDFCSTPSPAWIYPARSFLVARHDTLVDQSLGGWAACDTCHNLIEAGNSPGLLVRSVDTLLLAQPEMLPSYDWVLDQMKELHAQFSANRTGSPKPFAP